LRLAVVRPVYRSIRYPGTRDVDPWLDVVEIGGRRYA